MESVLNVILKGRWPAANKIYFRIKEIADLLQGDHLFVSFIGGGETGSKYISRHKTCMYSVRHGATCQLPKYVHGEVPTCESY